MKIRNRTVKVEITETEKQLNLQVIAEQIAQHIKKELTNNDYDK